MNNTKNITTLPVTPAQLEDALVGYLDDVEIRNDYSGRAMYGAECFGLVLDKPDLLVGYVLGKFLDVELGVDADEVLLAGRSDNMGYSTIVYFPGFKLQGEFDEFDDED
jgi:hypothetical protein